MKRFHVHVAVDDLDAGIRFYSKLFGEEPSVTKDDYAKWTLDDPRVNFAISHRGHKTGINHLGFQVESGGELAAMRAQLEAADSGLIEQTGEACCYAKSDKYWVTDPAGIAWETFHTLASVPVYGSDTVMQADSACCIPLKQEINAQQTSACCVPNTATVTPKSAAKCCG